MVLDYRPIRVYVPTGVIVHFCITVFVQIRA